MRLYEHFGSPNDNLFNGDIDSYDYLFLGKLIKIIMKGNYVDRGIRSLETILLLFALKLKYHD